MTPGQKTELLTCPFWHSVPHFNPVELLEVNGAFHCECTTCGAEGPYAETSDEAVARWNRREPSHYDADQDKAVAARTETDLQAAKDLISEVDDILHDVKPDGDSEASGTLLERVRAAVTCMDELQALRAENVRLKGTCIGWKNRYVDETDSLKERLAETEAKLKASQQENRDLREWIGRELDDEISRLIQDPK